MGFLFFSYTKSAFRLLKKHKIYSLISVGGLLLGLLFANMLILTVLNELSYDKFHVNRDSLYRINTVSTEDGIQTISADSPPPLAQYLKDYSPEVKEITRVNKLNRNQKLLQIGGNSFKINEGYYVEPSFLTMFSYRLQIGDPEHALNQPNTIVITEHVKENLFPDEIPINQTIQIEGADYLITGVINNPPINSHMSFDILISWSSYAQKFQGEEENYLTSWEFGTTYTYVFLFDNIDALDLEQKVNLGIEKFLNQKQKDLSFAFTPVSDIYLFSNAKFEIGKTGNLQFILLLGGLVFLIVFISLFNFINLAIAHSIPRLKELSIRQTLGALPRDLKVQIFVESTILISLSFILSLVLIELVTPLLEVLFHLTIFTTWIRIDFLAIALLVMLSLILIVSLFPIRQLSSGPALKFLSNAKGSTVLSNSLIVAQFCISIFLLIGSMIINDQLNFTMNKKLGFEMENKMVLDLRKFDHLKELKSKLKNNSYSVSGSTGFGPIGANIGNIFYEGKAEQIHWIATDSDFFNVYKVKFKESNELLYNDISESNRLVLNETAIHQLKIPDPIGKRIKFAPFEDEMEIIGVVEDFNFENIREPVKPLAIVLNESWPYPFLSVDLSGKDHSSAIYSLNDIIFDISGLKDVEYYFLNSYWEDLYLSETNHYRIFITSCWVGLFISSMGIFAVTLLKVRRKKKELGIRIVMGASSINILKLLSRELVQLIMLSVLISFPITWYLANIWLSNFAYKASIGFFSFFMGGFIPLAISICITLFVMRKTVSMNPVDAIRTDK